MKRLDTSASSTSNGFPPKQGTWDFLQDAHKEIFAEILISKIKNYNANTPYILYGCTRSIAGPNTLISKGAIFWNGEVFPSPAQSLATPGGANVIVASILTSQYTTNADPVQFTGGGAPINVHNIRTVQYVGGASGSGTIGNFSSFTFIDPYMTTLGLDDVEFTHDHIDILDPQNYVSNVSFNYIMNGAKPGVKVRYSFGIDQGGCTITFPSAYPYMTLFEGNYLGTQSNPIVLGGNPPNSIVIEFTYIGQDNYGSHIVTVSMFLL